MTTQYDQELARLDETYVDAIQINVSGLKKAFTDASEESVIAVGSGGSFTIASLICSLHEKYTGRLSRSSTPLELIWNPTLAASSPVFLVSAEGKNPDILEALHRARLHSSREIHIITNRASTPLIERAQQLTDISIHHFPLSAKDGYLATNSLLLDAVLVARAYAELDGAKDSFPASMAELKLRTQSVEDWTDGIEHFARETVARKGIIIVHSPLMKPVAADLESKLSEAALLYCQVVDLRSFAHGRHLWLADRAADCTILALVDASLQSLWESTRSLLPHDFPIQAMEFPGVEPVDILTGFVGEMKFVAAIAKAIEKDVGRANVPNFGRELHYLDYSSLIAPPTVENAHEQRSKYDVLGAKWPSPKYLGKIERAAEDFKQILETRRFKAIVFDYDGTLCRSQKTDDAPSDPILCHLRNLIDKGITIGIASGRGGSVLECLQRKLDKTYWPKVQLGLYNGGWLGHVGCDSPNADARATSEFLSHVMRIVGRLKDCGVPIEAIKATHPYQVSVRFRDGVRPETMWFVISDALRQAGLDLMRVVHSKHSVDILEAGVNKSHLIAEIIKQSKMDPYEILTMGDQGAWPGNDASLLEHRFSVSVDVPSRRLDRGWKFGPHHRRDVDAALWYLDRITTFNDGTFQLAL